ncbi:hypothetical protein [Algibacter mikhailovii]|uniref:Uncharacterized protein n=1 Tax=Algibacter mikhailovii TaxID=425498 RepID=A0A918RAC3_9FLAO|nr:hypothetical protein [Algibacter mikhailovii]GGZ91506.1 hypothetical protein GCM10007028_32330 [Algibacter mikhailovii]
MSLGQTKVRDSVFIKNGIENPSLLTTHSFGIFSSRINTNFKRETPNKNTFTFTITSGNNFQPLVTAYIPKDPTIRAQFKQTPWNKRKFNFIDQQSTPAETMTIVIDAVIKEFRFGYSLAIAKKQELTVNLRSYLITKGKYPFTIFTSDETIEWFHSNINGGEDPFGRRYYGLNQVNFKYTDRNERTLELHQKDFFVGGIEFSHYYYPELSINKTSNLFFNFGSHLGINTSSYNTSLDFGISLNALKQIYLKNNYELNMALGGNVLRKNLIDFKEVIDFGNNPYLGTAEGHIEITKYTKKGHFNALGFNYQIQSSYNKKEEANYYRLTGNWKEINGHWETGISTLYRPLSNWSFIYTYGSNKIQFSLYFKEDFQVNNAPDFQVGSHIKFPLFN